ncbi:MAG: hypothetical protein JWR44_657 [Hymenobacter sp.]|nr:hypothetical protein [Hymenobacter sp.]
MPTRYYPRLAALAADVAALPADQLPRLRKLLETVLRDDCKQREAPFVNLSQAIGEAAYAHDLPGDLRRDLQGLRLAANLVVHESYAGTPGEVANGFAAVAALVLHLTGSVYDGPRPVTVAETAAEVAGAAENFGARPTGPESGAARSAWRVHVLQADEATGELTVEMVKPADGCPAGPFRLVLPVAYANVLSLAAALHPTLHLIGPVQLPDDSVRARRVVLEPDYLISVTTVAECAQATATIPEWALLNAFLPDETSRPLVLGNLVNLLLDEEVSHAARQAEQASLKAARAKQLVAAGEDESTENAAEASEEGESKSGQSEGSDSEEAEFNLEQFLRRRLFRSAPLSLSTLPEFQTRTGVPELLNDLRRHHRTLRDTRAQGFVAQSRTGYQQEPLRLADCFLEPTFLSATYGLQGRLDLLHESATGYDLVELKSSTKVPHGEPWSNHAAQAQLYRLLLESVFGADGETSGRGRTSILYSNAASGQAAVRRVDQDQDLIDRLLSARNQLVGVELQLARATGPRQTEHLLAPVLHPNLMALPSFGKAKAEKVANAWAAADPVERAYCLELARFTAREMRLTLLGDEARPGDTGGQAGLWLLPQARKHQNFSLLDDLELLEDHSNAPDDARGGLGPHLIFRRSEGGREVNFRAGDTLICIRAADKYNRRVPGLPGLMVKIPAPFRCSMHRW